MSDRRVRDAGVRVVATSKVAPGFELAGIRVVEADDAGSARARVRELTAEPDVGVVLIQEDLVDDVSELEAELAGRDAAVLVPFPGPLWTERPRAARDYVSQIVQRAVGYRVRL